MEAVKDLLVGGVATVIVITDSRLPAISVAVQQSLTRKASRSDMGKRPYKATCQTCIFSKEYPGFHKELINCNYFNVNSLESIIDVMVKYRCPLKVLNVQRHCKNHLKPMIEKQVAHQVATALGNGAYVRKDSVMVQSKVIDEENYESVIDDTIRRYHQGVREGTIKITAREGLAALKMKSDIVGKNKDRNLDAYKSLFKGADGTA